VQLHASGRAELEAERTAIIYVYYMRVQIMKQLIMYEGNSKSKGSIGIFSLHVLGANL
jgi:hypothetical protein